MSDLLIDLFAGGGGASLGIERATGRPVDLAVDYWSAALDVHKANHPNTRQLHCDVWDVNPLLTTGGRPVDLIWASPDCTYHSKARGRNLPKSHYFAARSRALATVVTWWARAVQPRVIVLENVEEFVQWGPLDANDRPCQQRRGRYFNRWIQQIKTTGYSVEWRLLSACDYGVPTTRRRLFIVARRDGEHVRWAKPTHGSWYTPYRTAAEIINWSLPCRSIFERKRPLAEATLMRIAKGIHRYVICDQQPFILRHGNASQNDHTNHMIRTGTLSQDTSALCNAFLYRYWGRTVGKYLARPYPAMTTRDSQDELCTAMLTREPAGSRPELRAFIMRYYGSGGQLSSCRAPLPTATSKARMGLVVVTIDNDPCKIVDIGMRMLSPRELARAQGFPDDYKLNIIMPYNASVADFKQRTLPKADQYAIVGNSVCPPIAEAIVRANK